MLSPTLMLVVWLLLSRLQFVSTVLSYSVLPQNISQGSGASASFLCVLHDWSGTSTLTFNFSGKQGNGMLNCPSDTTISFSQVHGQCQRTGMDLEASWFLSTTTKEDNGSYVVCQSANLTAAYAYLTVSDNKSYVGMVVGCAIGGFLGIFLIFGLTVIALKHSEQFRMWFGGRTPQDDVTMVVEDSKSQI